MPPLILQAVEGGKDLWHISRVVCPYNVSNVRTCHQLPCSKSSNGCRCNFEFRRHPFKSLKGLCNLEELYLMGFPSHHLGCQSEVLQFNATLLQTLEKLRIAVVDVRGAPVRFLYSLTETKSNLVRQAGKPLYCLLLQWVCSSP